MWLWLGNFKRWQRRYLVASEAPGVLLIYKRSNMKGKVGARGLAVVMGVGGGPARNAGTPFTVSRSGPT